MRSFNKVAKIFYKYCPFNGHGNGFSRDHKSTTTSCEKIDVWHDRVNLRGIWKLECKLKLLPPQGFRPEGEIAMRYSSNWRLY